MLYKDLELQIFRKDKSENKKISCVANTLIKKSNPNKKVRTVVAQIDLKRVQYKGLLITCAKVFNQVLSIL